MRNIMSNVIVLSSISGVSAIKLNTPTTMPTVSGVPSYSPTVNPSKEPTIRPTVLDNELCNDVDQLTGDNDWNGGTINFLDLYNIASAVNSTFESSSNQTLNNCNSPIIRSLNNCDNSDVLVTNSYRPDVCRKVYPVNISDVEIFQYSNYICEGELNMRNYQLDEIVQQNDFSELQKFILGTYFKCSEENSSQYNETNINLTKVEHLDKKNEPNINDLDLILVLVSSVLIVGVAIGAKPLFQRCSKSHIIVPESLDIEICTED